MHTAHPATERGWSAMSFGGSTPRPANHDRRGGQHTDNDHTHTRLSVLCCLLSAVCCLLTVGCVTRSLTIKTDPPGALVYVNDQLKGPSPVTYDFVWYGWHRIMVRKEGFQRLDDRKELRSPIYLWIPFDFAIELLPFRVHDDRTWSYVLTPAPSLPTPVPPQITTPGALDDTR